MDSLPAAVLAQRLALAQAQQQGEGAVSGEQGVPGPHQANQRQVSAVSLRRAAMLATASAASGPSTASTISTAGVPVGSSSSVVATAAPPASTLSRPASTGISQAATPSTVLPVGAYAFGSSPVAPVGEGAELVPPRASRREQVSPLPASPGVGVGRDATAAAASASGGGRVGFVDPQREDSFQVVDLSSGGAATTAASSSTASTAAPLSRPSPAMRPASAHPSPYVGAATASPLYSSAHSRQGSVIDPFAAFGDAHAGGPHTDVFALGASAGAAGHGHVHSRTPSAVDLSHYFPDRTGSVVDIPL